MDLVITTVPLLIASVLIKKVMKNMDPTNADESEKAGVEAARKELAAKLKRNGRGNIPQINKYEERIMNDMVFPDQISVSWKDVGGLEGLKEQIYETVVLPLQNPGLFRALRQNPNQSSLATVPRGILFYGPPGTGKTMLAKVIAKDCAATFINISLSTLQNKWFGESQKLVRALFSVARKLAPTIIFLDEIDLFFRERTGSDHEATSAMKSEFMALWDGMTTDENAGITVLGATNRPFDIDMAILRRLPRTFLFDLPEVNERRSIIEVHLGNQRKTPDFDFGRVAEETKGYSGSDLKELCKFACMLPVRRLIREQRVKDVRERGKHARTVITKDAKPAPLSNRDLTEAVGQVKPTGKSSYAYQHRFEHEKKARSAPPPSSSRPAAAPDFNAIVQLMASMMQAQGTQQPPPQPGDGHDEDENQDKKVTDVD